MSVHKWIYHGKIKRHEIELNHSPDAEKLLVKLNGETLYFDSGEIKEDKNYFFLIDGILCSIQINVDDDTYKYNFQEEEILSGNRVITQDKRRLDPLIYSAITIILFILLLFLLPGTFKAFNHNQSNSSINSGSTSTTATVVIIPHSDPFYQFNANGKLYQGKIENTLKVKDQYFAPTGMPLYEGDEFEILYETNNPKKNVLFFNNPTTTQIQKYKSLAYNILINELHIYPVEDDQKQDYSNCVIHFVYNLFGVKGLSSILNKGTSPEINPYFNSTRYRELLINAAYGTNEMNCRKIYLFNIVDGL